MNRKFVCSIGLVALISSNIAVTRPVEAAPLTLEQSVRLAQQNDPWFSGNSHRLAATKARAIAADSLPEPMVSLGIVNVPVNSWALDQEAMTQVKVGVSQIFPRGDSLALKAQQFELEGKKFPILAAERRALVAREVTRDWLAVYQAQAVINLIERDKSLFRQLVDVTKAGYSSADGKTRQQDVIRAQLELIQLDDRLNVERQNLASAQAKLYSWVQSEAFMPKVEELFVPSTLPSVNVSYRSLAQLSVEELAQHLLTHPLIRVLDVQHQVAAQDIALAREQYKPQWGVNASYALRDDAPNGASRADFFSLGVTFDLPWFGKARQDQQVSASIAQAEAVKTQQRLQLRTLIGEVNRYLGQLEQLEQRAELYAEQLLTQLDEQAEAALTAYTNDEGDFAEVIRAKIALLNAKITALTIKVDQQRVGAQLNYFTTQHSTPALATEEQP